mmetsp:Transcript_28217/g.92349  ORF Transcript_28217/g.92349 Transcript_28217/m.92349 type:complete len:271 (-) Transcript_28217:193-1005(-)
MSAPSASPLNAAPNMSGVPRSPPGSWPPPFSRMARISASKAWAASAQDDRADAPAPSPKVSSSRSGSSQSLSPPRFRCGTDMPRSQVRSRSLPPGGGSRGARGPLSLGASDPSSFRGRAACHAAPICSVVGRRPLLQGARGSALVISRGRAARMDSRSTVGWRRPRSCDFVNVTPGALRTGGAFGPDASEPCDSALDTPRGRAGPRWSRVPFQAWRPPGGGPPSPWPFSTGLGAFTGAPKVPPSLRHAGPKFRFVEVSDMVLARRTRGAR